MGAIPKHEALCRSQTSPSLMPLDLEFCEHQTARTKINHRCSKTALGSVPNYAIRQRPDADYEDVMERDFRRAVTQRTQNHLRPECWGCPDGTSDGNLLAPGQPATGWRPTYPRSVQLRTHRPDLVYTEHPCICVEEAVEGLSAPAGCV